RSVRGGTSLAQLLAKHRGVRNTGRLPKLRIEQVLAWADAHRQRTGRWPQCDGGAILDAPGETWQAVQTALVLGLRGLPGGSSLAQLLAEYRGMRNRSRLPTIPPEQVRTWAVAHRERTGQWPTARSGPVESAPGETWMAIEMALFQGRRGLPKGLSIARVR